MAKRPGTRYMPLCLVFASLIAIFFSINYIFSSVPVLNFYQSQGKSAQIFSPKNWKEMTLQDCYKFNSKIRNSTKTWIRREDWESPPSRFNYGLPPSAYDWVDKDVGPHPIGHDLLSFFMIQLALAKNEPIHYLEIGVSVGKCLLTQCMFLGEGSYVYAFDFEYINPTLANNSNLKKIGDGHFLSNTGANFFYELGDVTKDDGWETLATKKLKNTGKKSFNIIYSDALHNYEGVSHELLQLFKHNLLDLENFVMVWDDCQVDVKEAMMEVYKYFPKNQKRFCNGTILIGGWLGTNEYAHHHCILTSLNLKEVVQKDELLKKITWIDPVIC